MEEKNTLICMHRILTGVWNMASEENKKPYMSLFSNEQEAGEFHKTYFQWYNIVHEFCHHLRRHHNIYVDWNKEGAYEEQVVNDFAVAYWKKFGEASKLKYIIDSIEEILSRIPNPIPKDEDFIDYFNQHFQEANTVELYGFLQFTCVKRAFYSSENLSDVLKRFGIKNRDIDKRQLIYENDYHPQKIIDDCCKILNDMGVTTPSVEVGLLDNPLIQQAE